MLTMCFLVLLLHEDLKGSCVVAQCAVSKVHPTSRTDLRSKGQAQVKKGLVLKKPIRGLLIGY